MITEEFLESKLVFRPKTRQADLAKHVDHLEWIHMHCFPSDDRPDWSVGTWWITWDNKKPVAFIGIEPVKSWKEAVYISRVGVVKEHRGKGIQAFLMSKVVRASAGFFDYMISSTYENPASANSFIKCGFKTYLPEVPWGAAGTIYWSKEIK
jgi:GNAT superfamily N-acetyltransferase